MLKIKDSVSLSELEKFGFRDVGNYYIFFGGRTNANISIYKTREIEFDDEWYGRDFEMIDLIYSLIKADLVEKVENDC